MAEPIIQCTDLVRIFAAKGVEVQALQGLTLTVERGELLALVGASGSGKSTLLTILSGLDQPSAGSAVVAGHDLLAMDSRQRIEYRRHTVGFVWQQTSRNLFPYLSAAENVAMALSVARAPRARRGARTAELLEQLGIGHLADRLPGQMSGGQQQRVAIAVALANEPQLLLADEPTGELDQANSAGVLDAFREVNERTGTTVVIVTHDPGVANHVRRTVRIRDGRIATEVHRRTHVDDEGVERVHAEEFAVIDRVGRLQLPSEYMEALELRERVRLSLEPDRVEVRQGHRPVESADPARPEAADDSRDSGEREEAE